MVRSYFWFLWAKRPVSQKKDKIAARKFIFIFEADFSFFFCRPYICFYRFIFSGSGRKIKATANGPAIIILKMNGGCFIFSVSGKNKMANIRRLLFWAEAKVREIKRQWPKIIRYTPPINIFIYFSWPQRSAGNGKIKATPRAKERSAIKLLMPANKEIKCVCDLHFWAWQKWRKKPAWEK